MKISILLPNLCGGGAERVNLDLAHEFSRQGHEVELVLLQAKGDLLAEAQAAFKVIDLDCTRFRTVLRYLPKYLRKRKPDALLAAMWPLTVIAPLQRLTGYRGRVVVSEHGILSAQYKSWGRIHRAFLRASMAVCYRFAHGRVGVSAGVAKDIAVLSALPEKAIEVVHNPVRSAIASNTQAREKAEALWECPAGARILTVGSMKVVKNHPLLLRAFAQLNLSNARLMFVGTGAGEDQLHEIAAELGVDTKVIFAGFQTDPTAFYESADVFVLSSNYEGFGNVIVEALACATPVVSTNCPSGPTEILAGGKYGRLVPVGDASALSLAIESALSEPYDPISLKTRAADFAPEIAASRYLELLCR